MTGGTNSSPELRAFITKFEALAALLHNENETEHQPRSPRRRAGLFATGLQKYVGP